MTLQLDRTPGAVSGTHQDFLAAVGERLGPAHAAFFATPLSDGGGTAWVVQGGDSRAFADLDPADREALRRYAGSVVSDIRRVAEGENSVIRRHFAAMRRIPSLDYLYAVDGRAVVTRWGAAQGHDPLGALDDGRSFVIRQGFPRLPPRLLSSALAGAAAGFLVAALMLGAMPAAPACVAPATADLPQGKWQSHDLSMLRGCWHRISNMVVTDIRTNAENPVAEWTLCFADDGRTGRQTLHYSSGAACSSNVTARFEGDTLVISAERCVDHTHDRMFVFLRTIFRCTRLDDLKASCPAYADDPLVEADRAWGPGVFQRSGLR
ncbi:hypothetical protein Gdia_3214 [Gluconacetobacter diazotrophicus PA1 5]|uniref:Transmembrane protein n=1 Tax=Gluconacetobacter diazotrophicus TaxID=33996 RepID=A0A7W4NH93_GLUDI|nr:hypothetical protein [Gluconacetobacter diazotrophicus]ACI52944.1 hypothetical protein Gdia_3214 [Gluconacetobacter diazotrophicus PA1 5]MBB2157721.1 hypothetical protein [Gluconacetobacter diazotrophicus]TWB08911.1 hypothetical protein FBZ86_10511 [Gluconacetobacter diazotrophicus]